MNKYFSTDYPTAKARFLEKATARNAFLYSLNLDALDVQNESLCIDIAWLGTRKPRSVIIHSSGLHGVEGFAGSAIQLKLLDKIHNLPDTVALILVHVLNPYGMALHRRTNENNVDLNRNYLMDNQPYKGSPDGYAKIDSLINPVSPPSADFFYAKALYSIIIHGFASLKQSIAGGQYDFPKGLFYGGDQLQQGLHLYCTWLKDNVTDIKNILAVDVHTGLGKWGVDSLFVDHKMGVLHSDFYSKSQHNYICTDYTESLAYKIKGGMVSLLIDNLKVANIDFIMQEFGSYSPIRVLHALREENRCHFYSNSQDLSHPAKWHLKQIFCPDDENWQSSVLDRGVSIVHSAINQIRH